MPAAIVEGRLLTKCEVCGGLAPFGTGTDLRAAMKAKAEGNIEAARKALGKWYCGYNNGPVCLRGGNDGSVVRAEHQSEV